MDFVKKNICEISPQKVNWIKVAKDANLKLGKIIGAKPISGLQLFQTYMRHHNKWPLNSSWTAEEDDLLKMAVDRHGPRNWKHIANYINGKSTSNCFQRWHKHKNPEIFKGRWTLSDDIK